MRRLLATMVVAVALTLTGAACSHHHDSTSHAASATTAASSTTTASSTSAEPQGPGNRAPGFGSTPPWWHPNPTLPTAIQTSEQWDAVDVSQIPAGTEYVAGYVNGHWPTVTELLQSFPSSHILTIAVNTAGRAMCLDIEPGDAVPSEASAWVRADQAAGFKRPCIYAPLSLWQDIWSNLAQNGIDRSSVFEWSAHWTNVPHLDAGFDATQWTDKSLGRSLDESMVAQSMLDYLFGKPAPPVNPLHYDWLPTTRRTFVVKAYSPVWGAPRTVHANERGAARYLDAHGCVLDKRSHQFVRQGCVEHAQHARLLGSRLSAIARRSPNLKHPAKSPRWGAVHYQAADGHKTTLGGAERQMRRRYLATSTPTKF